MPAWLVAFWAKSSEAIMKWVAIAVAVLAAYGAVRKSGRDAERADALKKQSKRVEVAHEVENKNQRLPDGGAANRLRDRWSRD